MELMDFVNFVDLPKKRPNSWKSLNSSKRENLNSLKRADTCPRPTPIYKLSMTSTVWNISISQIGLSVQLCSLPAPAHLLVNCT